MKQIRRIYLTLAIMSIGVAPADASKTIVIVRHGEKPTQGLGQLTCQGLNRSLALAPILLARYGKPVAIYAPNPGVQKIDHGVAYAYIRPLATIEPLAIEAGLPVNLKWGMTDIGALTTHLLMTYGTQIVAWEHHWGESLARQLFSRMGGNPADVPQWKDNDFDSVFVIRAEDDEHGIEHVTFRHEYEGLNGLSTKCAVPHHIHSR